MSADTRAEWDRLRELVHGDDAQVLARAVTTAVRVLEQQKYAATDRPARPSRPTTEDSRHVPAEVKRQVAARDGGRCAFTATTGHRCAERRFLEFHHVKPWMAGGATTRDNVQLRCRAHNQYEADLFYGPVRTSRMITGGP
jgi:hypothetical protein